MKSLDKNKDSSHIQYLDENNLYGWAMYQTLPVSGFKWKKKILLNLMKTSQKTMMKIVIKDIFLK